VTCCRTPNAAGIHADNWARMTRCAVSTGLPRRDHALALLRLLPMSDRDKDAEILALRHQSTVLERHLRGEKILFTFADRAFFAALLHRLPRDVLRRIADGGVEILNHR
jgi:hypothetical protein